jgi:hypothetical protein
LQGLFPEQSGMRRVWETRPAIKIIATLMPFTLVHGKPPLGIYVLAD